jgi:hypothetical protein
MKIQIIGGKITENLRIESLLLKVKKIFAQAKVRVTRSNLGKEVKISQI